MRKVSKDDFYAALNMSDQSNVVRCMMLGEPPITVYQHDPTGEVIGRVEHNCIGPNGEYPSLREEFWNYYLEEE